MGGKFLRAEDGGGDDVFEDLAVASADAAFTMEDIGSDKVAIRALSGEYLRARRGGGSSVKFDSDEVDEYEQWTIEKLSDGKLALKCFDGDYLVVDDDSDHQVMCEAETLGPASKFELSLF